MVSTVNIKRAAAFCRHGLEQSHNGLERYWKKNAERAGR